MAGRFSAAKILLVAVPVLPLSLILNRLVPWRIAPLRVPRDLGVFVNCAAARAAPVRSDEPGYGPHLDRDDDGVGCEPRRR